MSDVIVFCESQKGELKKGSLELLNAAKKTGKNVLAVVLGPQWKSISNLPALHGSKKVFVCTDEKLKHYNPQAYSEVLNHILKDQNFEIILASSTLMARDLFPRLAAKIDAAVVSDCTELDLSSGTTVRRPMYAGKCTATVKFKDGVKKIILIRPNQLPVGEPDPSATAEIIEVSMPILDLKTIVKDVVTGTSEKLDLTEANIIVSGGRGLKEAANFKMLEELADTLGATIGASRAVCDAGWIPHSMQVGQTGKTVAPTLYIAVGISGAIQHLAGMSASKVIVAINNDPEAPIFQKATYGIVGDAFEVVPKLTEEFKKLLN
ncbi:MAG: electron transfer flavoprotein subunit alpha/FixB family protein [Bdellovibrionaceae bacterium]|nr:electron transfer flavoprotein subunit alpha/FixB family protein [Pseudobdellovibrionaceae bacterium]